MDLQVKKEVSLDDAAVTVYFLLGLKRISFPTKKAYSLATATDWYSRTTSSLRSSMLGKAA